MKHFIFKRYLAYFMCAAMAIGLAACSSDDDGPKKDIELAKGTEQEQTVFADDNGGENNGIKFTAAANWTATVTEMAAQSKDGSTVDWLTLNVYSGGPGEHTLIMTIKDNLTGKARKAQITILCGETKIVIVVEQKAAKADGTIVKPIRSIIYRETLHSPEAEGYDIYTEDFDKTFSYDTQGRVARIVTVDKHDATASYTETYDFDYNIADEINITRTNSGNSEVDKYRAKLNGKGNVDILQEQKNGNFVDFITFTYTNDERLSQFVEADDNDNGVGKFTYENGLLAKYEYIDRKYDEQETTTIPVASAYPNRYPNNGAVDIVGYMLMDDEFDFLFFSGHLGKTSDCLPELYHQDPDDEVGVPSTPNETPGVTIHKTSQYTKWPGKTNLSYKFDNDKNITEITATEPFEVWQTEWDVVVGTEFIDPENQWRGYKYEIKNKTERKVRDDKDVHTFTISY